MARKATQPEAPSDEHHGHGGSYVVGADGRRTLTARTKPAKPELAPEPAQPVPPTEPAVQPE